MDSKLIEIIESERAGVESEIAASRMSPFIALQQIDFLERVPTQLRTLKPATVRPLYSRDPSAGWVFDCPGLRYKSFWVHPSDEKYRDHYKDFLRIEHGWSGTIPRTLDVDHLFNKARGIIYDYRYVRTFLVPASYNRSHGAGYEKAITDGEKKRFVRDTRKMDEVVYMKFSGVKSPLLGQSPTPDQQRHFQKVAALTGLPCNVILETVENLMRKANSDRAAG